MLGGYCPNESVLGSIESLNLIDKSGWNILVQSHQLVQRVAASIVAISSTKLLVHGGIGAALDVLSNGYIFDVNTLSLVEVLDKEKCYVFSNECQTYWLASRKYVSLG